MNDNGRKSTAFRQYRRDGSLICVPLGLISTVGTYQLQITGRMKVLMILTVIEGLVNLVFDLLFVGPLRMGVAGAGYGTLCANFVRCTLTLVYITRKTHIFEWDKYRLNPADLKNILLYGLPDVRGPHNVIFATLDDGKCIHLDHDREKHRLITDNYDLIRKVASSVEYRYLLNMNCTKITI